MAFRGRVEEEEKRRENKGKKAVGRPTVAKSLNNFVM